MAGASITCTFEHAEFTAALHRLAGPYTGLLRAIAVGLQHNTIDRFHAGRDPDNRPWAALSPAYAAAKTTGTGILIGSGMRGGLQGSITSAVDGMNVVVGSNKVYAAIQQFGGTIRPVKGKALVFRMGPRLVHARSVTLPARPYLGFSAVDQQTVLDACDVLLPGGRTA